MQPFKTGDQLYSDASPNGECSQVCQWENVACICTIDIGLT